MTLFGKIFCGIGQDTADRLGILDPALKDHLLQLLHGVSLHIDELILIQVLFAPGLQISGKINVDLLVAECNRGIDGSQKLSSCSSRIAASLVGSSRPFRPPAGNSMVSLPNA